ncbi:adenylate/guanylate cyclase domain-containing protein [Leptospira kmetyi]|uniref:Adenylate cyclase n=1 Tax=Leptospira kmetyi TaxID=408139 RepID=A0A5F1XH04_9LEPT|nr:adenylate/guanylate cyclase domain-containing protein [Leptospira kmetyi]AYV57538.1 adenylate/guanylate cyclase domain-containing protein [Leptospira kmetyi]PJZ28606.1 adenylate cyclase [Leptospira kmetyi]TGK10796.1 adenylate/guanylate cyclase domain-containing protein [Leptospira kmetyi]TGK25101.1 adenylate/guanylate cyclase domain-containing protein [Leptospira kmetyi]
MVNPIQESNEKQNKRTLDPLAYEILKSEIVRTRILFLFFSFSSVLLTIVFTLFYDKISKEIGTRFPFYPVLGVNVGIALYEFLVNQVFQYLLRNKKNLIGAARFGNVFVEISAIGLLIWLNIGVFASPLIPLYSPAVMIFFVFIILSVLRLEFWLSAFTGFVAGAELFILAYYYIPRNPVPMPVQFFNSFAPFISKGVLFTFSGVAAGLVGHQLKRSLISAISAVQEKNKVVGMFGQYVSPDVVDKLLEQKNENFSEFKSVCIMFLDIRNFTRFSEKRAPGEVIDYLNYIFTHLIDIVNQHNGMINKFLGDGFMAVFGAPLSDGSNDVKNAVDASREILKKIEFLNQEGKIPETSIGIGLHTGEAMTGNVGSETRKEYTIIGDVVNLASRVEQLNKQFGTKLLVTQAVYDDIKETISGKHLSSIQVKGREEPVDVYELDKI